MNNYFNLEEIKIFINNLEISEEEKIEKIKGQIESRLIHLRGFLNESDYQVIKCLEAKELEEEMPYDLQSLIVQRKAWREEINALEFQISMLE